MQSIKKQIFLIGVLLLSAHLTGHAQVLQNESDSSGNLLQKSFLNDETVSLYGKNTTKKLSPNSISVVQAKDIRSMNTPTLGNSLAGRLPGLMVSMNGGAPGNADNPQIRIRGIQTFLSGADGITVLVDGFETDWQSLHPDEIESIQVLRDAGSLVLYGNAGANGILYIKTKRGEARGKAQITFNSRVSLQQATVLPEFLGNGDFAELYNVAMESDGKDIANGYFPTQEVVDYYKNGTYPSLYPNVNWYDEMLKPYAVAQDYTLSMRGGEDRANYNVMLGYSNTPGLYGGTNGTDNSNWLYSRYMTRINLDFEIAEWLHAIVNTRGTISQKKQPFIDQNTMWGSMGRFLPFDVKTPAGNWGGTENYRTNPVAQLQQQGYQTENSRTIDADVKVVADLDILTKGLSAFGQVVFSNYYFWDYRKTRGLSYEEITPRTDTLGLYTSAIKGDIDKNFTYAQVSGTQWNRFNGLAGLEYTKAIGSGTLYASSMYLRSIYKTVYTGNEQPFAKLGFMGRVNYNLKNKYIAEFGYSYIGTDNYAPGNKYNFYPAISGAWVLSNEDFMSSSATVNFLKLRASHGIVGNDRIGELERFPYFEYYMNSGAYRIGNNLAVGESSYERYAYPNEDITMEKAHKTNIGIDAQLFKNLSVSADYFFENREDILVDPTNYLSALIGSRYSYLNLGSAKNNGAEVELMYSMNNSNFSYFIGGSFSYVKTEVVDSKEPPRAEDYLYRRGNPIGQPFVLEHIGFFADSADIANSPYQTFGSVQPGDVKYRDQNGDDMIDGNDVIPVGKTDYPSIMYSLTAGASYAGFDFSVFVQGVNGRTISLLSGNQIVPILNDVLPTQWVKDNYWTEERGNNAKFPRLTTESNDNNYRASTLWQRDGSFIRIKNVEIGYTLPSKGKTNLRIYFNAVNPLTFDKIDEIEVDPEINNVFLYPVMKSYNLGLNLVF